MRRYIPGVTLDPETQGIVDLELNRRRLDQEEARRRKNAEEVERIDAALKRLSVDPRREDVLHAAVEAIQAAQIPVLVTIGEEQITVARPSPDEPQLSREGLRRQAEQAQSALPEEKHPTGWSRFWGAIKAGAADSVEFTIPDIELGLVKISPSKFLKSAIRSWVKSP